MCIGCRGLSALLILFSGSMTRAKRIDFYESKLTRVKDSNGFARVEGYPTRAGVFVYRYDGKRVRELRHPDEVFKADSLETLKMKPFTIEHYGGLVTPETAKDQIKGTTGELIEREGNLVKCNIAVFDQKVLDIVDAGEKIELSSGYTCDTVQESGVWEGEEYDAIQKNIVYNHVSIVEKGRAGKVCRLKLDADDSTLFSGLDITKEGEGEMRFKIDGYDSDELKIEPIELSSEKEHKAVSSAFSLLISRIDSMKDESKKKEAKIDSLTIKVKDLTKKTEENGDLISKMEKEYIHLDAVEEISNKKAIERALIMDLATAKGYNIPSENSFSENNKKAKTDMLKDAGFNAEKIDSDEKYLEAAWDQWTNDKEKLKKSLLSKRNLKSHKESHLDSNIDYSQAKIN